LLRKGVGLGAEMEEGWRGEIRRNTQGTGCPSLGRPQLSACDMRHRRRIGWRIDWERGMDEMRGDETGQTNMKLQVREIVVRTKKGLLEWETWTG
jgi:hypothetical protein